MANCICQIQFVQIVWVNYSPLDFIINGLEMKDDKRGGDMAIHFKDWKKKFGTKFSRSVYNHQWKIQEMRRT